MIKNEEVGLTLGRTLGENHRKNNYEEDWFMMEGNMSPFEDADLLNTKKSMLDFGHIGLATSF